MALSFTLIGVFFVAIYFGFGLLFFQKLDIRFDEKFNPNSSFSIACVNDTADNRRLFTLVEKGIREKSSFEEFNKLRKLAIDGAYTVRHLTKREIETSSLKVPKKTDLLIVFNYDKSGSWLFEVWELEGSDAEIVVGSKPRLNLKNYLFGDD